MHIEGRLGCLASGGVELRGMPGEGRKQGKVMQQCVGGINQSEEKLNHVASKCACRGIG